MGSPAPRATAKSVVPAGTMPSQGAVQMRSATRKSPTYRCWFVLMRRVEIPSSTTPDRSR